MLKAAQSLYSTPAVPQFYHLGYSCSSGIALPCKKTQKTTRLGQIEITNILSKTSSVGDITAKLYLPNSDTPSTQKI